MPSKNISLRVEQHPYPWCAGDCVLATSTYGATGTATRHLLYEIYPDMKFDPFQSSLGRSPLTAPIYRESETVVPALKSTKHRNRGIVKENKYHKVTGSIPKRRKMCSWLYRFPITIFVKNTVVIKYKTKAAIKRIMSYFNLF